MRGSRKLISLMFAAALGTLVTVNPSQADSQIVDPMRGPTQIFVDTVKVPLEAQRDSHRRLSEGEEPGASAALPPLKEVPSMDVPDKHLRTPGFYYSVSNLTRRIG